MKPESNRSDLATLFGLLLLVGGVFFLLYSSKIFKAYYDNQSSIRSTFSINIDGTLLWYTLLERLHHEVVRLQEPLLSPRLQEIGILCILDPKTPLHNLEYQYLKQWIEEGGVLLCKSETDLALQALHEFSIHETSRFRSPSSSQESLLQHIRSIDFHKEDSLSIPPDSEANIVYRDHAGIRIAEKTFGNGRVIVLAEDSFLTNGRIQKADNSVLAIHLMDYAVSHVRTKAIAFDEYHFGYGDTVSDWGLLLILLCATKPGWALLCWMAAGMLYLLYLGRRFGTQLALAKTTRGSEMEYIAAAGEIYRRTVLTRRTLQELFLHLKNNLCQRYGVSPYAPHSTLFSTIQSVVPDSNQNLEAIFREVETALGSSSLSVTQMTRLLQQLGTVERELLDEPPRSA